MNETPRAGDAARMNPGDGTNPDERSPGGEGTTTGNELGAHAGTTTGLGGTGAATAGGGFGRDLSGGTTPEIEHVAATPPYGDPLEQAADPIRYAWRGWNDPAYQREVMQRGAQAEAAPQPGRAGDGAARPT